MAALVEDDDTVTASHQRGLHQVPLQERDTVTVGQHYGGPFTRDDGAQHRPVGPGQEHLLALGLTTQHFAGHGIRLAFYPGGHRPRHEGSDGGPGSTPDQPRFHRKLLCLLSCSAAPGPMPS